MIKKGTIVVRIRDSSFSTTYNNGYIFSCMQDDNRDIAIYQTGPITRGVSKGDYRFATANEILLYNEGIRNIYDKSEYININLDIISID